MFNQSLSPEVLGPIKIIFFQECDELLSSLESGLEALKQGSADPDTIQFGVQGRAFHQGWRCEF